ncbi:hypothetical protein N7451_000384 [Penicillium sp. IBT 35674x]|nr:hypothetical protein N7451_000384 [Penicillium sp. IBT 35674x]
MDQATAKMIHDHNVAEFLSDVLHVWTTPTQSKRAYQKTLGPTKFPHPQKPAKPDIKPANEATGNGDKKGDSKGELFPNKVPFEASGNLDAQAFLEHAARLRVANQKTPPKPAVPTSKRRIIFSNLPYWWNVEHVMCLVHGGPIDQIMVYSHEVHVDFIYEKDCIAFGAAYPWGIDLDDETIGVKVDFPIEEDPAPATLHKAGMSRVVRVNFHEDKPVSWLLGLVDRDKVEHIVCHTSPDLNTTVFYFLKSISYGVKVFEWFKNNWSLSVPKFELDPCQLEKAFHFNTYPRSPMLEAKRHKIPSELLPEEPGYMEHIVEQDRSVRYITNDIAAGVRAGFHEAIVNDTVERRATPRPQQVAAQQVTQADRNGGNNGNSSGGVPLPVSEETRDVVDDGDSEGTRESDWSSVPSVSF